jgi:hypothetical protein
MEVGFASGLFVFRRHLRACVRSRACFASAGTSVPASHALAILLAQNLALPQGEGVMRWGCAGCLLPFFDSSSPGLTKTSEAKSRSKGKRSAAVRPGDPVLPALVARCVSFGQSPALGPGSRDGLSVHTVRDDSFERNGKAVPGNLHPPWQGKNLRAGKPQQKICQPVNGRRHGGACGNQETCSPLLAGKRFWHGGRSAQPSKVSVSKKAGNTGHSILHRPAVFSPIYSGLRPSRRSP